MKVKVELELDTDNLQDLARIEEVVSYLQEIKYLLEQKEQNLNKSNRRKTSE